jgi:hypothetical protein
LLQEELEQREKETNMHASRYVKKKHREEEKVSVCVCARERERMRVREI